MTPPHPELIKAELRIRYGSMAAFERYYGLPDRSARDVLRGKSVARTAQAIAAELDRPVHELFPGRFEHSSHNGDDSAASGTAHRLNDGAK